MIQVKTYGTPVGFERTAVARVTRVPEPDISRRGELALVTSAPPDSWGDLHGYRAVVTTHPLAAFEVLVKDRNLPVVHSTPGVEHLRSGDVIALTPRSGLVRTVFRPDSPHNALLATERCNSYCLMCSQPPIDRDDLELVSINREIVRLMSPSPNELGITGGEPTLLGEHLFSLLAELKGRHPSTSVHMLTNGRRFAWPEFTAAFAAVRHPRLSLGIPLYSERAAEHDYVVQARGAFDQTMQGLYQLARHNQAVEIRVVLHALTIGRLCDLAEYIYRNLPFACHVALMGLEITGFTKPNLGKLWVDPYDYQDELERAVEYLAIRGMNVSIYNHQLCVLRRPLWKFARKSISDWKNLYLDVCNTCGVLERCGGLFMSAEQQHSAHLRALSAETLEPIAM